MVSQKERLVARKKLLLKEKKFSQRRDELNLRGRQLPWVKIETEYVFDWPTGKVTLADLFDGKSQLIIYHNFLDLTAKGRDERPDSPQDWVRHHDAYKGASN